MLDAGRAVFGHGPSCEGVVVGLDELEELVEQEADVSGRGFAFEDRLLAAEADLFKPLGDPPPAPGLADVVGDDPFHGEASIPSCCGPRRKRSACVLRE